jgi:pimeloyl-ACP methyl ester carboxylesterase
MSALSYETYVTQGGDIGSFISCQLGQSYPECCRAVLVNMLATTPPRFFKSPLAWAKWIAAPQLFYSRTEMDNLARTAWFFKGEAGYQVDTSDHCFSIISDLLCRRYKGQSHRVSVMACGIHPSHSWLGLEKNWTLGVTLIRGAKTKSLHGL